MSPEEQAILSARFEESRVEWRRLADNAALEDFLREVWDGPPPAGALLPHHFVADQIGFTLADALIVETGSIVISGRHPGTRRTAFLAEIHYALLPEDELYGTLAEFFARRGVRHPDRMRAVFGHQLTLINGPSRTADIEKILVLGAHGPRRLVLGTAPTALLRERFAVGSGGESEA